jgi:hypothetical protein
VDKLRIGFVKKLFIDAGFSEEQADARSRLVANYLIGDPTLQVREPKARTMKLLALRYEILVT